MSLDREFDKQYRRTQRLMDRADALLHHILEIAEHLRPPAAHRSRHKRRRRAPRVRG